MCISSKLGAPATCVVRYLFAAVELTPTTLWRNGIRRLKLAVCCEDAVNLVRAALHDFAIE
jgi:hypothetical protein